MQRSLKWSLIVGVAVAATTAVRVMKREMARRDHDNAREAALNEALDGSFPASDPPAHTAVLGSAAGPS